MDEFSLTGLEHATTFERRSHLLTRTQIWKCPCSLYYRVHQIQAFTRTSDQS